jgi:metal-responsive CopG/Arc/MetJ family transcriptional regulator
MNISIPQQQSALVDSLIAKYGFANRSEFFRSLLRLVIHNETIIEQASTFPFIEPKSMLASEVVSVFTKTGSYSKEFLHDLEEGLSQSKSFSK